MKGRSIIDWYASGNGGLTGQIATVTNTTGLRPQTALMTNAPSFEILDWWFPLCPEIGAGQLPPTSGVPLSPGLLDFWPHISSMRYQMDAQSGALTVIQNSTTEREYEWECSAVDWTLERVPVRAVTSQPNRTEAGDMNQASPWLFAWLGARERSFLSSALAFGYDLLPRHLERRRIGRGGVVTTSNRTFDWTGNPNSFAISALQTNGAHADLCLGVQAVGGVGLNFAGMRASDVMKCVPSIAINSTQPLYSGLRWRERTIVSGVPGAWSDYANEPNAVMRDHFSWMWLVREREQTPPAAGFIDTPTGWSRRPRFLRIGDRTTLAPRYRSLQSPLTVPPWIADGWGVFDQLGYALRVQTMTGAAHAFAEIPDESWWLDAAAPLDVQIGFNLAERGIGFVTAAAAADVLHATLTFQP